MRWHCPPDTGFEIRALAVRCRARYLTVIEAPHNLEYLRVSGEETFCFFETRRNLCCIVVGNLVRCYTMLTQHKCNIGPALLITCVIVCLFGCIIIGYQQQYSDDINYCLFNVAKCWDNSGLQQLPKKHNVLIQCWFNFVPPSTTLAQQYKNLTLHFNSTSTDLLFTRLPFQAPLSYLMGILLADP